MFIQKLISFFKEPDYDKALSIYKSLVPYSATAEEVCAVIGLVYHYFEDEDLGFVAQSLHRLQLSFDDWYFIFSWHYAIYDLDNLIKNDPIRRFLLEKMLETAGTTQHLLLVSRFDARFSEGDRPYVEALNQLNQTQNKDEWLMIYSLSKYDGDRTKDHAIGMLDELLEDRVLFEKL